MTLSPEALYWITWIIFGATYFALAWGGVPGLRIDRAGIALVGAAAMLATGVVSMKAAAESVDAATIALLLGMMIVVGCLQMAGFFEWVTQHIAARFSGAYSLLAIVIGLSGTLSALLVNDVVCVALTPLILRLCGRNRRPPVPYLIALATAANVGSVAAITGNPQNIIIGSLSGISYLRFAERLAPVAGIGLVLNFAIVAWVYRRTLSAAPLESSAVLDSSCPVHRGLMIKTLIVMGAVIILFFSGFSISIVALSAAAVCLLGRVRPEKIYRKIDWSLLLMFVGLFIVVHAFDVQIVRGWGVEQLAADVSSPVPIVSGLSLVLSNLVSNVPAVLLFKPIMPAFAEQEQAWLALAMSSTLAGNLTLLGSVANLIVVETARKSGIEVSFIEYLKAGVVLTLSTTAVGIAWLMWTRY